MWQHSVACVLSRCYIAFTGSIWCCDSQHHSAKYCLLNCLWEVMSQFRWEELMNRWNTVTFTADLSERKKQTHGVSITAEDGSFTSLRGDHSHFPQSSTQTSQCKSSMVTVISGTALKHWHLYWHLLSVKSGGCVYISHILGLKHLKSHTGDPAAGVARPTSPGANQCHGRLNTTPYVSYSLHSKCIKLIC